MKRLTILISNDDSYISEGLIELIQALQDDHDLYVIVPAEEQSAQGHGITLHRPIRRRDVIKESTSKVKMFYAVDGTPADCIKLGVRKFLITKPDIVLSGINTGPNLGGDIIYSGTVSAAHEGLIEGVPAIAVSCASLREEKPFTAIAQKFVSMFPKLYDMVSGQNDFLLNVNFPYLEDYASAEALFTVLGNVTWGEMVEERTDPEGKLYYWLLGKVKDVAQEKQYTDIEAIQKQNISITPVHFDMTALTIFEKYRKVIL
ncbi:5'/3'-nucleotidase SurE [Candidatus Margulisiibacteriota bacterium]